MTRDELRKKREKAGLTQEQLAEIMGVHPLTVSRWERGVRSISEPIARFILMIIKQKRGG